MRRFGYLWGICSRSLGSRFAVLLAGMLAAACSTFSGIDPVTREDKAGTPKPTVILEDRKNAIYAAAATSQQQMRNDLQNQIIRLSDAACDDYLRSITRWDKGRRLFFNSISIIAGGVAPLFSSGATESLAVASGLATSANAEISATVFEQLAFDLVESAIKKSRIDKRKELDTLQKKTMADYGVEAALRDAGDYHQLCALRRGLETLRAKNEFTPPSKVELEEKLAEIQTKITAERNALKAGGLSSSVQKEHEDELQRLIIRRAEVYGLLNVYR